MSVSNILDSMEYGPSFENNEEAIQWLDSHKRKFEHFIGGKWISSKGSKSFDTINPCSLDVLASISQGNKKDVDQAAKAAGAAFKTWSSLSSFERSRYLYALARQIQKHARLFSVLESLDNGKPIRETRDIDIPLVIRHFYYHAGWAIEKDTALENYEPIGVIGQIVPWNFPHFG